MDNPTINPTFEHFKNGVENEKKEAIEHTPQQILASLEIDPTAELPPPQIAWEQNTGDRNAILGTLGNFSLIIGKAKSRKSFFVNIAVSAVLNKDSILGQFTGRLPDDKRTVLYFDTEQGEYHVQLAVKRICDQIGEPIPSNLKTYHLRRKSPQERLKLIEWAVYNTPGLGFVVIDGIKDLITSINDEAEATMIASKLLKWTEEKEIHIVTVLHQNKGDNNARGHIGTELINKAETTLSVTKNEKDERISIVEAQFCRGIEPEPFAFEIDGNGIPVIVEDFEIRTQSVKERFDPTDLDENQAYFILKETFSTEKEYKYTELVRQIKLAVKTQLKQSIGDNKTKDLITHWKNQNWLSQNGKGQPYSMGNLNVDEF